MKELTNKLNDAALRCEGTFYLPYRLHISRDRMRSTYPMADSFFLHKRRYDPQELFSNKFYEHYR